MEPVSVLSVAAATVQFLEFGLKTLKLCKQIRDSDADTIELHAEVQWSIKRLKVLQDGVTQGRSLPQTARSVKDTSRNCLDLAKDLHDLLKEIRAIAESGKRFAALKAALRSLKDKKKIEKLEKRLEQYQNEFQTAITVDTREQLLQLLDKQGNTSDTLKDIIGPKLQQMRQESSNAHSETQSKMEALGKQSAAAQDSLSKQLLESGTKSAAAHDSTHRQLSENKAKSAAAHNLTHRQLSANRNVSEAAHKLTHKQLSELQASSASALDLQNKTRVDMHPGFDHAKSSQQIESARKAFLDSLWFMDMFARQESIRPPSTNTYEWIFNEQTEDEEEQSESEFSWSEHELSWYDEDLHGRFKRWLCGEECTFWINGKAGSGKSCLMSFIETDERTIDALKPWAGDRPLHVFSFFFWRPGSELQKSICGLLRSMLHQLAEAKPEIIDDAVPDGLQSVHLKWTESRLLGVLRRALEYYREECIFCMIDGLDEFNGDYSALLDLILGLQAGSNIKLCLSSRPEADINHRLWSKPSVRLQDLNYHDIETHVQQKLEPRGEVFRELIPQVAHRAEGIFLWAVLVTDSLISGKNAEDNYEVLLRRLERVPAGLKQLFGHMFANIDDEHREKLSMYFTLLKWSEELEKLPFFNWGMAVLTDIKLATILQCGTQFESIQQFLDACSAMKKGIPEQAKGLIELTGCRARKSNSFLWALKVVRTGRASVQSQEAEPYELLTLKMAWVHRSVYDCVLGDSSDGPAGWMKTINERELVRKVLHAIRWLTERIPMQIELSENRICSQDFQNAIRLLRRLTGPEGWHDPVIVQEVYCTLDGIYDSFCSSVYNSENCQTFSAGFRDSLTGYEKIRSELRHTIEPLMWFWGEMRVQPGQGYLVSRFGQIKRNAHARDICLHFALRMLRISHEWSEKELPGDSLILQYLLEEGNSGFDSNELRFSRHARFSWHNCYTGSQRRLNCFLDTRRRDDSIESWSARARICDAMQIFRGTIPLHRPKCRPLLQMQLPVVDFVTRGRIGAGEGSRWQGSILRLLCRDVRAQRHGKASTDGNNKVAAHFDLSTRLTSDLMTFLCHQSEDGAMVLRFTGSPKELAHCFKGVQNEIWANKDGRLNAWRQLYVLACVKTWFEDFWISRERAVELGRIESEIASLQRRRRNK